MISSSILNKAIFLAKQLLIKSPYDEGHNVYHHYAVWSNCLNIVCNTDVEVNTELLELAAWMHDIERKNEKHSKANRILQKALVDQEIIAQVLDIIREHTFGKKQTSVESKILFDADKIEYFSVARFFSLENNPDFDEQKLQKYFDKQKNTAEQLINKLHYEYSNILLRANILEMCNATKIGLISRKFDTVYFMNLINGYKQYE